MSETRSVIETREAIPAATLVLFREGRGAPELLFVERARAMAFAGGALVFPGGRVDPGDHAMALTFGGDEDDMAARIAAIRETIEEVGLAIGVTPTPDVAALPGLRAALHRGDAIGVALNVAGLTIDPGVLVPFARWLPSHEMVRLFDARFYLARLPSGAPEPAVDDTENVRVFWSTAQQVLNAADTGQARIIYPTRRNLERLAQFASFDEAVADVGRYPQRTISPSVEERGGVPHLCIPSDLGYPVTAEAMSSVARG